MKTARVLVLMAAMAATVVPPASAGSLLQSATRLAQAAARDLPAPVPAITRGEVRRSATAQQATAAEGGSSKRRKFLIIAVAMLAAGAGMYAIDHGVEDNTPSTKGTRKD